MNTYSRGRIRLAVDVTNIESIPDDVTGNTPAFWRGTDLGIELGFFLGDRGLIDVTIYSSITIEVRDSATRTSTLLATKTLTSAELNSGLTAADWESGAGQHGVWAWTSEETRWNIQGLEQDFWLVISAITSDAAPRRVTLGATTVFVREDGTGEAANSPVPGDPLFLTAQQTAALIGDAIRAENPPGKTILLKSPNGTWGRLIGVSDDGAATDAIIRLA